LRKYRSKERYDNRNFPRPIAQQQCSQQLIRERTLLISSDRVTYSHYAHGVLMRAGQTEAAVDLARLADLAPAGVICEIMNEDGTMARVPELSSFASRHNLLIITVADLITYRTRTETLVKSVASTNLPTEHGEFRLHAFENQIDKQTHVVLVHGDIGDGEDVLVRVHSQCLTGDVFHSVRCDCGAQLDEALGASPARDAVCCST
jgi:3,4-dihydroxy 2-butanone 4-phosphate synthase / GTP cyclohydrolase II